MKFRYFLFSLSLPTLLFSMSPLPANAQKKSKKKSSSSTLTTPPANWEIDTLIEPIPIGRRLFTDEVEKVLETIDRKDGNQDKVVNYRDAATTRQFTQAFMSDAGRVIILVENLDIPHNDKVRYYKTLKDQLESLNNMPWDTIAPGYFSAVLENLRGLITAKYKNELPEFARKHIDLITLQNIRLLEDNAVVLEEGTAAKAILYKGLATTHPLVILEKIPDIRDEPYTDTIIADIARVMPGTLLAHALESGPLARVIKRNADPFVQTIVRIADNASQPMALLPFLGPIHREEHSITALEPLINNQNRYFQGLLDLMLKDEAVCRPAIDEAIQLHVAAYVDRINAAEDAESRLSAIAGLRDIDYYMLAIGGKDQLSSISFSEGVYPMLIRSMKKKSGLELLKEVDFYHYRTFLRLCAETNLMQAFFRTLDVNEKDQLFHAYSEDLETGELAELARAVEVANTFPYVEDDEFTLQLKSDAYTHYEAVQKNKTDQSPKGILTYGIMRILFDYKADGEKTLEERLGIASANLIPHEQLLNSLNEVVEQVYFYPGEAGKRYYTAFMESFRDNKDWEISEKANWTHIRSTGDKKISIYANKPLSDSISRASVAALTKYLDENNLKPLIVFHCGPLPDLSRSIAYLPTSTRVLLAGHSFGDENLINAVEKNNKIHILSSRQTSNPAVDLAIFNELNKQLVYGRNLNWENVWRDLRSHFNNNAPDELENFALFRKPIENPGLLFTKTYLQTLDSWINKSATATAEESGKEKEAAPQGSASE